LLGDDVRVDARTGKRLGDLHGREPRAGAVGPLELLHLAE
jgi:hypothetical protein